MTEITMSDLFSQETLRDPVAFYGRHLRLGCSPEQLSWNPVPYLRGLKALPVTFEAR